MIVLGIDPGLANCGWGVVEKGGSTNKLIDCGCVVTKPTLSDQERLGLIYSDIKDVIIRYSCSVVSVEKLFLFKNQKSVMEVAQVIGAIKLLGQLQGLEVLEYTPLQVKMSLVGYGRAEKEQVEKMVRSLLSLRETIKPSHASDAVAIALTHLFSKKFDRMGK